MPWKLFQINERLFDSKNKEGDTVDLLPKIPFKLFGRELLKLNQVGFVKSTYADICTGSKSFHRS